MTGMELRLTARRLENVLVTVVIPAVVLVFFASFGLVSTPGPRVDFLLPGAIALAILATGLVNLGIATAYERSYGVLKRLGGSPLPRIGLVIAKLLAVLVVEVGQIALLLAIAIALLGWRPADLSLPLFALAVVLGTVAFVGLGLALAGTVRAETVLALANLLFIGLLAISGIVVPTDQLPAWLASVSSLLPSSALAALLRICAGGAGDATGPLAVLAAWSIAAPLVAAATFHWE
jgi:ABC-2 type transport system permease protein